ncbi:hypothetical protein BJX64DRAFT_294824 [Aspergillus heterothallicus]
MSALSLKLNESDPCVKEMIGRYSDFEAFKIFKRLLEPGGDLDIDDAGKLFYEMLEPRDIAHWAENESQFQNLGICFLEIAEQIPYAHPSHSTLVSVMIWLIQSDKVTVLTSASRYYESLEDFKTEIYGHMNERWANDVEAKRYANMASFLARLDTEGILDISLYVLWDMRDALEYDHSKQPADAGNWVRVLAGLILCGGPRFFRRLVLWAPAETENNKRAYSCGPLYSGPLFGRQRWRFWHMALAAKAEENEVDEECRELGRKAADFMAALARDITF